MESVEAAKALMHRPGQLIFAGRHVRIQYADPKRPNTLVSPHGERADPSPSSRPGSPLHFTPVYGEPHMPRANPPPGTQPKAETPKPQPLRGHLLGWWDTRRLMRPYMFPGFVHFSRLGVVDYAPESRVVPNRNVVETKSAYEVVDVTAVAVFLHIYTFTTLSLVLYAWSYLESLASHSTIQAAYSWLLRSYCHFTSGVDSYSSHFLGTTVKITPRQCLPGDYTELFVLRLIFASLFGFIVLHWIFSRKVCTVSYVPHVVSSVVAEYSRGTNSVAASLTMRQRVLRLATMPLPDHVYLKLVWGSEAASSVLLDHQSFFMGGVLQVLPHK